MLLRRWNSFAVCFALCAALLIALPAPAQEKQDEAKAAAKHPTAPDGKKLFTALDSQRILGVGSPALSPDGRRVAYTVSETSLEGTEKEPKEWKRGTQVWVVAMDGGKPRQYTRGERNATSPQWSPDGTLLAFLSDREKQGERQVWMMNADGGEAWEATTHKGGVSGFRFSPDGQWLLLSATDPLSKEKETRQKVKDDPIEIDQEFRMTHLWTWNIEKKEAKPLTEGDYTTSDPQFSPDGKWVSYTVRPTPRADDGSQSDIWLVEVASGTKRKLTENPGPDVSARWSPDGKWIAYVGSRDESDGVNQSEIYVVAPAGGAPRSLTDKFDENAGTPVWSPDGKWIFFDTATRQAAEIFVADVSSGTVRQITVRGGAFSLEDIAPDGKSLLSVYTATDRPGEIYRTDADGRRSERLTNHNAWLDEFAVAPVEVVKWKSNDGTEIEGVLTKPVGYEAGKKYPLLLNPHGGPTGASIAAFNSTNQVLAANGHLVLQPNFRGSTGRGLAFAQANKNRWGIEDYQDCMSGVDAMIARGLADPEKLGAYGWSYGGYMTFWILTQTDRFKAVSPGAGLTNIYSMYSQNDIQRYLRWFYGDKSPWDNFDLYWDRSPMKYIRNVKTPTLILHGQNDTRVPIAQAQEFYRALVERKVPVEFVVYPREGHGFSEPRHQVDRIRRYVQFFAKYLGTEVRTEPAADKME